MISFKGTHFGKDIILGPAECRIGAASLADRPKLTSDVVVGGSVGRSAHRRREIIGHALAV
jgi:hypothetical protein